MQHNPPRSAKRTFPPHIPRRLTAASATYRRISSTLAIVALVSLLALWSILMAVSRDNEAHAQVSILTGSQQLSPNNRVLAQNPPVVILKKLSPNPIQVGHRLRIEVQISPSRPMNADRLIGGVQIFDPADSQAADLYAFAFHAGQTTVDAVSYLVPVPAPDNEYQVPRTIRVAINPAFFPDYQVGSPASDTVRVIGVGDPPPTPTPTSTPTAVPPPPPLPTATFTPTNTPLPTATFTFTPTPTYTATATPTVTPPPPSTPTNTVTVVATATFTPTNTPQPTATSRPTNTPRPTATSRPTNTPRQLRHPGLQHASANCDIHIHTNAHLHGHRDTNSYAAADFNADEHSYSRSNCDVHANQHASANCDIQAYQHALTRPTATPTCHRQRRRTQ